MARVELALVPGTSGPRPVASAVASPAGGGGDLCGVIALLEVLPGVSGTSFIPGGAGEDVAVSGLDIGCVRPGARLRLGRSLVSVLPGDPGAKCVRAEVLEEGEVCPGDDIAFERDLPVNCGVLTLSDTCHAGGREDLSGPALIEALESRGMSVVRYLVLPDDRDGVAGRLRSWCDDMSCDLVLTTGGTGFSPRDFAPEALADAAERLVPGIPELIRMKSAEKVPSAWLSRASAGIRARTLMINLPGSLRGATESLGFIEHLLDHALEVVSGRTGRCGG